MEPMTLSFGVMLGFLQRALAQIKDPRQASNGTPYSIDDLYIRQPMAECCLEYGMNFIFICLPESHLAL
jgi:hypothetical protein